MLLVHFVAALANAVGVTQILILLGVPLAVLTAVYTGYLFAQAKARDLWQNPLLPPHLVVQALLLGAAILVPLASSLDPGALTVLLPVVALTALLHLLFVWGESTLGHPTAHARLATEMMLHGPYSRTFWTGVVLCGIATFGD